MYLIVGLGNPGKEYERTRHNVGFLMLDHIYKEGVFEGKKCILLKPTTFMNLSGQAVAATLKRHKLSPDELVVIHDDIDIPFGQFKIQKNRGSAGHNGVKSIIETLGTKNFTRVRIGIHPPLDTKIPAGAVVLKKFSKGELATLAKLFDEIEKKLLHFLS